MRSRSVLARAVRKVHQVRLSLDHRGVGPTIYWAAYGYLRPNRFLALARDLATRGPAVPTPPGVVLDVWPAARVRAWRAGRADVPLEFVRDTIDGVEFCAVATLNGDLAGLIWLYRPEHASRVFRLHPGEAEINHGYVRPEYRERRLFQSILDHACRRLGEAGVRTVYAAVHSHNDRSHRAFLAAGFRQVGAVRHFLVFRPRFGGRPTPPDASPGVPDRAAPR